MSRSAAFLQQVEQFLQRSGMTPTAFGKAVARDSNFVRDLREGRVVSIDLCEHVEQYIAAHNHSD